MISLIIVCVERVNVPCFYSMVPDAFYYAMQYRMKGSISEALHIMTSMNQYQHIFSSLQIKYVFRMGNILR